MNLTELETKTKDELLDVAKDLTLTGRIVSGEEAVRLITEMVYCSHHQTRISIIKSITAYQT